ncbi:AEC family transporter [Spirochaetota bacterium]
MDTFAAVFSKIVYIFVLIVAGALAKKYRLLSENGEKDLSRLLVDLFWPALIFVSITEKLNKSDILVNWSLPVLALVTGLTGYFIGSAFVRIFRYKDDRKRIFLYHSIVNNFIFMVLPFAAAMIPGKGAGLLFVHNLGYILIMWTLGVWVLQKNTGLMGSIKNLLSIGLISTVCGITAVLTGFNTYIPKIAFDILNTIGSPTVPVAMIIAGARIYRLGKHALKFDSWNIILALIRLVIVPGILFLLTLFLKQYMHLRQEVIIIFMLVNIMPVSVNSVSLAMRFKSSPDLAAQGVVMTHVFSIITVTVYMLLIEYCLL